MVQSAAMPVRAEQGTRKRAIPTDLLIAAVFIAVYGAVIHSFRYQGALAESDLYRVLVGLLDGAYSGKGLGTDLHYDREFGFGYLAAFYAFADPAVLRDPDRLIALMNQVGFYSILVALCFFWWAVRLVYGAVAATVALIVFALAPMIPELATSAHQVMPMLVFLNAAAVLLFLPIRGWWAIAAAAGASVLLLVGLTVRGEMFLAFPWLVLARADISSFRGFLVSCVLRSIPPVVALVAFVILQRATQPAVGAAFESTIIQYFIEFYTWKTVTRGTLSMILGCGIATVVISIVAGLYLLRNMVTVKPVPGVAGFLAAVALVLVPFAFFVPNPEPTRHFLLTLMGYAILIGMAAAALPRINNQGAAVAVALLISAANQVAAEAARLPLLRINETSSPYLPAYTSYRTTTHVNLGWEWRRHEALVERRARWQVFADQMRTACEPQLIVLSDETEQLFSRLYAGGTAVKAERITIPVPSDLMARTATHIDVRTELVSAGAPRLLGLKGIVGDTTFIILDKSHAWPADAVAVLLAMPDYAGYRLIADPYTLSKFDRTPIPPERQPHFGCAAQ